MTRHAVTVLGRDRPGTIAATTALLAALGLNLEDSTMTLLQGHFAMVLVTGGDAPTEAVEAALAPLAADGSLTVAVRALDPAPGPAAGSTAGSSAGSSAGGSSAWLLSVHGADRPGIVSGVLAEVAAVEGNVTDLSTRLSGGLYVLLAEVDLPATADADRLAVAVRAAAEALGVTATLRPADPDEL